MQEPPDLEPEKAPKSKRHRGPTMLPKVHARTREEREVIVLNSLGQPIGPTREIVQEFKQFLGTVARDSELAPLNYIKFPCLPTVDKMWEYVQEKYMVPEAGREWVMQAINGSWKAHKCLTKKNYFYAYPTDALRWFHKPNTISEPQFRELLQYWHSKEAEKQQDPDKQDPSQARVYKESRKRTVGRTYLTNQEKIAENIAKMDALESSQHEDGSNSKDPYSEVIPEPKRKSRVRLQGKGC
ncbi:uncharacterized protein LOC110733564 isoform X2 [Chenopodium quinoa]|uniref:uncharacterized protein LOC110733564 isoform X2 n=1 Tax=Chenopodium quinoa TaxID=63459 RepID=UPI000B796C45|nr:uncharacterized protein LOC110733564 isoform X2 [Chenopodium quinoa]